MLCISPELIYARSMSRMRGIGAFSEAVRGECPYYSPLPETRALSNLQREAQTLINLPQACPCPPFVYLPPAHPAQSTGGLTCMTAEREASVRGRGRAEQNNANSVEGEATVLWMNG